MAEPPLVVLAEALDQYFLLTRLGLGKALLAKGFRVAVLAGQTGHGPEISKLGFEFIELPAKPKGLNPMGELNILKTFLASYRRLRPDWIHHFTPRPIVYGSLAARLLGIPYINTITGLGYTFTEDSLTVRRRLTRFVGAKLFQVALGSPNCRTIVQNPDDYEFVESQSWTSNSQLNLIRSSGVDCQRFIYKPELQSDKVRVVMPGRILWDKGVAEFVEACRWLQAQKQAGNSPEIQMVLVGEPDPKHPTSVPPEQLTGWVNEGLLEWAGFQSDMVEVFSQCQIVVLPSYREGFPKALLEAAACGRPLVGADVPGVREIVHHQKNGLRVPVKDGVALGKSILELAKSPALRSQMGLESRKLAESCSLESVVEQTFQVYASLSAVNRAFEISTCSKN